MSDDIIQEEEVMIEDMGIYDESIENFEEEIPEEEDPDFDKDELEIETD